MQKRLAISAIALALGVAAASAARDSFSWHLPPGISPPVVPADNPMSAAKVALGRRLFYDADLSADGTTSCGTCHEQHRAFTEGNASHPGVGGVPGRRNVMSLTNVAWLQTLTWADPNQKELSAQSLVPLMGNHPIEMGMMAKDAEIKKRLESDPCYGQMFAAAFPETKGQVDTPHVTLALAAFERTLVSYDTPYDHYLQGDTAALSDPAKRGLKLFSEVGCAACHAGINFTDQKYHNIGLYDLGGGAYPGNDHGLKEITGKPEDEGRIRTPTLRNVALTPPYMHDGSVATLQDAIERHLMGNSPLKDVKLKGMNTRISTDQRGDLIAFLQSLSDNSFVTNPDLALPKTACGKPL